jgi:hypothetical protein
MRIVAVPISIEYYGQVTEAEHQLYVNHIEQKLKAEGLEEKHNFNPETDRHIRLYALPESHFDAVTYPSGQISVHGDDGKELDCEMYPNIWEGLNDA